MDDLELAAAGEQVLAVGREAQPVKRLIEPDVADDLLALEIDNLNLVVAVASVQHRQPAAAGVEGQVDGKVAEPDLFADGPERPLVRQQDGTPGLDTGQDTRAGHGGPGYCFRGPIQGQHETRTEAQQTE